MQLHTPRRYGPRRPKRGIISLRWLWLYLLAPVVIFASVFVWDYKAPIGQQLATTVAGIKLPDLNPNTPTPTVPAQSLEARIETSLKSGNTNDAIAAMQQFVQSNVNDSKWHVALAMMSALRSDGDQLQAKHAADAGLSAINAAPESSTAWAAEALALDWSTTSSDTSLNNPVEKQAFIDVLHAQDLNNSDPVALAVLAGIDVSLNKFTDASSNADAALKLDPNNSYAYFVKGQVAALNGNAKAATNFYKQAWDISQSDLTQWGGIYAYNLAIQYIYQGQIDQAKTILSDGLKYDKNYPRFGRQLSDLYFNQGDPNKAIETAQQCTDTSPTYAPCWAVLPKLYSGAKSFDRASHAADTAAQLGSTETSPYYWGGEAYYQLNDCAHAIPLFQKGLQIAQQKNVSSAIGDFTDALNQCGITPQQVATPTPGANASTPLPVATSTPTTTPTTPHK